MDVPYDRRSQPDCADRGYEPRSHCIAMNDVWGCGLDLCTETPNGPGNGDTILEQDIGALGESRLQRCYRLTRNSLPPRYLRECSVRRTQQRRSKAMPVEALDHMQENLLGAAYFAGVIDEQN